MKRFLCLLFVFSFLLLGFASCGGKEPAAATAGEEATVPVTEGATEGTAEGTTTGEIFAATTDRWNEIAPKVTIIAEKYRRLKYQICTFGDAEKSSKNREFIAGPDTIEDGETPVIQQMVFERNKNADDLLGTSVEYEFWDDLRWAKQAERIVQIVQGNAADAPDLFVDGMYDLNKVLLTVGAFKDVRTIPGSYFDFDAEGWMTEWMESMSLTGDRAYLLGGDYFIDLLRTISVIPFNVDLMDANAAALAPAIQDEDDPIGENEKLSTRFFDLVEEEKWIWDVLGKLCEAIWEDTDGDGQDSINDRLGILGDANLSMSSGIYCYSNGEQFFETREIDDPNSKYYKKNWVYYPDDIGVLGGIFDAVTAVYAGKGSLATFGPVDGNTSDNPGMAYHWIKFSQGETLFAGACVLGALEDEAFQQMRDLYSVVPLPKVSADGKYNCVIHDTGCAGSISVNASPFTARVVSAHLQYCTEHSKKIREQFLQIVTKYTTAVYNQGTDRMLELIYRSAISSRDKMIENYVGGSVKWHEEMKKGGFEVPASELVSIYAANYPSKQSRLNEILALWYTLPKVETPAE